jgi:predicted NACHT family NTPase
VIRLATNPLLMTIIAMIHYKGKKLPNKRVELYDVSTETFLEYWVQLRMDDASQLKDKNEIIEILAPIAFEIHQNKSNALIEEKEFVESFLWNFKNIHTNTADEDAQRECREFIDFLRQQTGFFYEKGVDDEGNSFYGFIHLTFEEYLAAIELVSKWTDGELDLKDYVFNPRWTEIIRLAAALLRLSYKGKTGRKQSTHYS